MNQSNQSNFSKTERAGVQALRFLGRMNEQKRVKGYLKDSSDRRLKGFDGTDGGAVRGAVWQWLRSNAYIVPTSDRSRWVISQRGQQFLASLVQPEVAPPPKPQKPAYKDSPRSRWESQQVAVTKAAAEIIAQRRALREQTASVSYSL